MIVKLLKMILLWLYGNICKSIFLIVSCWSCLYWERRAEGLNYTFSGE